MADDLAKLSQEIERERVSACRSRNCNEQTLQKEMEKIRAEADFLDVNRNFVTTSGVSEDF